MRNGEVLVQFVRGRFALNEWLGMLGFTMDVDIGKVEDLYLSAKGA